MKIFVSILFFALSFALYGTVLVGVDRLEEKKYAHLFQGKRIGVVTNHTGINKKNERSVDVIKRLAIAYKGRVTTLFSPEHGLRGEYHAGEAVFHSRDVDGIPIYSLHGKQRRPTKEMLKEIDLLFFDMQDIGSRSYTYATTLFYVMEEAAKERIPVVVLDRPNPINGIVVDGPMMEEKWRSFVGHLNVPYVHGMTIGELARFFNEEYAVGCSLTVVPMEGWRREMTFAETGLPWIPTSPNIPEKETPLYYPMTGILGELQMVNIGIGYTLPFRLIGAPWIDAEVLVNALNQQHFPGVMFSPFHYKPVTGSCAKQTCQGVLLYVTDPLQYRPVATGFLLMGMLKSLYPKKFEELFSQTKNRKEMFCQVIGSEKVYAILEKEKYVIWPLRDLHTKEREAFLATRDKYLIY